MNLMQKHLLYLCFQFSISYVSFAQTAYTVYSEKPNEKTYEGIISRQVLLSDTSFHWYAESAENCYPNPKTIKALRASFSFSWVPGAVIRIM
jgi:hypothetical protein